MSNHHSPNHHSPNHHSPGKGTKTILQLVPQLNFGGVEQACLDMITPIADSGMQALVVSGGGDNVPLLEQLGGRHENLGIHRKNPLSARYYIAALRRLIRRDNVVLVHAHSRMPAWLGYYAARHEKIPFITSFHAAYKFNHAAKRFYNSVMTRGDKVIVVSDFIRQHVLQNYSDYVQPHKLQRIYNGIDFQRFAANKITEACADNLRHHWGLPRAPCIVLPARPSAIKGHALAIQALANMRRRDVFLLFVVPHLPARETQAWRKLAQKLGVAERLYIRRGSTDSKTDNLPACYVLGDVCLSASQTPEAFGRTVAEAQALQRIVVAPAFGGALEQIQDGVSGFLYTPRDVSALANRLELALSLTPEARQLMLTQAHEHAFENFALPHICQQTMHLYQQTLSCI